MRLRGISAVKKDSNLQEKETQHNMTKTIALTTFVVLAGQILNPITFLMRRYFGQNSDKSFVVMALVSNTLLFGSYGVNMVIFYAYNRNYRSQFKRLYFFLK